MKNKIKMTQNCKKKFDANQPIMVSVIKTSLSEFKNRGPAFGAEQFASLLNLR